jgi:hypothetical protein
MQKPTHRELYETALDLDLWGRSGMDREPFEQGVDTAGGTRSTEPVRRDIQPPNRRPTGVCIPDHLRSLVLLMPFLPSLAAEYFFHFQSEVDRNRDSEDQMAADICSIERKAGA